ncbi:YihY/virulence factor BrkB family protein [Mesorhizobium sp. M0106]|uniref:YihY/virulence factor BrkB family protein n=2 Tax=unclassified Mesorhizobium TaxID=325217 RepID=UPI00333B2ADA
MANEKPNNFHAKQVHSGRRAQQPGRGRDAVRPTQIPTKGWKDILWRVIAEVSDDRVPLIAAGTTFYLLLALFPALAAFVSIYGFVADPKTIAEHIAFLSGVLPSGGLDLIRSQLGSLAQQNTGALTFGFILGLAVALWSANNGIKIIFEAMNIAYEETEKRSLVRLNLLALAFTLGAIFIGIAFLVSVGLVPAALALLNLGSWTETLIKILRWPVMLVAVAAGITLIYRYGPSREKATWRWLTWGAGLATVVWLAASIGFSFYLENFANYNATYGTLGAVIGFMMWTWISVMILIVGAELNSEMEHQTAKDTTTGAPQPIGARGAAMADTLGRSAERSGAESASSRGERGFTQTELPAPITRE